MMEGKEKKRGGKKEKTDENSGHYVVASSRPPERGPLERRTLAPISVFNSFKKISSDFCQLGIFTFFAFANKL